MFYFIRSVRKAIQDEGLNKQLPKTHPLIVMFNDTLRISHGDVSTAFSNNVAKVSRVLYYVQVHLLKSGNQPKHWADLVTTNVDVYETYISRYVPAVARHGNNFII